MHNTSGRLRILHIVLSIGETNAAYNEHCLPWANKRDISICTFFESSISPPDMITLFEGDGSIPGFIHTLRRALAEKEYDIIHAHTPHVGLLLLVTIAFSYHRFAPSTVMTVHDSYPNFKLRNRLMLIPVFAAFRKVICCGQASFDSFPNLYKWLAGNRLGAVQNGLDIARVDHVSMGVRGQLRSTSYFNVIAISRLVKIKNPSIVLTAFQKAADQNSRLIYIGDGPLRQGLVTGAKEHGLEDSIEFTGLIPRERVFEQLFNADLFISSSQGEGLPVAVLEAMSSRCPVLLSDILPHREIAEGTDFIPLIHPDDADGFAQEIERFKSMTRLERAAIGQKCREVVEKRFSLSAMHAGYAAVYAQITGEQVLSLSEPSAQFE